MIMTLQEKDCERCGARCGFNGRGGGLNRFGAGGVVSLETDGVYRVNGAF